PGSEGGPDATSAGDARSDGAFSADDTTDDATIEDARAPDAEAGDAEATADARDASDGAPQPLATPPITAFGDLSCLRTPTKTWCWGYGITGHLGDGTNPSLGYPPRTVLWTPLDDVAAGVQHVCGRQQGSLVCWGRDSYGELGHPGLGDPDAS